MTTAHYPNRDALQKGLDIYLDNMSEFVVRVLRRKQGSRLKEAVAQSLTDGQRYNFTDNMQKNSGDGRNPAEIVQASIEIGFIPHLVERNWSGLFQLHFKDPTIVRNTLRLIRDIRNNLAHDTRGQDIKTEKAQSNLYTISEALVQINRPQQAKEILKIRADLVCNGEDDGDDGDDGDDRHTLKPWRKAIQPKADVAEGSFQEADFAADLQQVFVGSAPAMYGDPLEFFRCTHITRGIRDLLVTATKRVNGKGGNPIIQTKTGFGGGKTHSLIALYHLTKSADELLKSAVATQTAGIRDAIHGIMVEAGVDPENRVQAQVCVLQGSFLSPTSSKRTDSGDPLNTLWGEMAWQLGRQDAYEIVGAAARQGTAPGGEELDNLFHLTGPCVILIDEIVNYARNADLDTISTFFQNLTEAVKRCHDVALIVTLPVSTTEAGGDRGSEIMAVLENLLNRVQAVTQVAQVSNDEAFAVVRRRLFQEDYDEAALEETCQAFYRMYQQRAQDYPPEARETRYLDRLRHCYPIHPEVFNRLYEDWSLYHNFQRTRGVLRTMAHTISWLCAAGDDSPLIMPGNLPFSETSINAEFLRLLDAQWDAVMGEVDQNNSRTHAIDRQKPERFGSVGGAARRTARTVFLGSATSKAVRGITAKQIHLGVVIPGHGAAVYDEALRLMDGALYYFYQNNDRYYFDSEENLNKVANDRAAELSIEDLDKEIKRRLREFNRRHSSQAVIACPKSPADVRDDDFARLVILRPNQTKPNRSKESNHAAKAATEILSTYGDGVPRTRPNTLLFLAASSDGIGATRTAARRFLAWNSIINGSRRISNLKGDRYQQSSAQQKDADRKLQSALSNAYRWCMAPDQPDPQKAEYGTDNWQHITARADIADNALRRFVDEELLLDALMPKALERRLEEGIWTSPNPRAHITVNELWDLLTGHIYLGLRLRNRQVLEQCLAEGLQDGFWGCAGSYNTDTNEYHNLWYSTSGSDQIPPLTGSTLIVKAGLVPPPPPWCEVLKHQLEEEIWNGSNPRAHITVSELWNLLPDYIEYLGKRLPKPNRQDLEQCLTEGLQAGFWRCADSYDPDTDEYRNLWDSTNGSDQVPSLTGSTMIVKAGLVPPPPPLCETLKRQLEEAIWNGSNPRAHITVSELWNLLPDHIEYLGKRLPKPNRQELEQCLIAGLQAGAWGCADSYNTDTREYRDLWYSTGESDQAPHLTDSTLIVKVGLVPPPRCFVARMTVTQRDAVTYDFNAIRDEIARAVVTTGHSVTVQVTVTVSKEDGISENIARSLRDNSQLLGLELVEDPMLDKSN